MSHCPHCPLGPDERCPGEAAQRLCDLVNPSHPDYRPGYRDTIRLHAAKMTDLPPLVEQAKSAAEAVGRVVAAAVRGEPIRASDEEHARRLAICKACEYYRDGRCLKCGCVMAWKSRLATERCPLEPPKWNRWEDPNNAAVDSNHLGAEQVNIDSGSISTSPG